MPQRSFISALFYSIRPSACLSVALFAVAGLGRWDDIDIVLLVFTAAFIGGAGCFLINDIFDREKDIKNNKLRPIATGEISVRTAYIISVVCCLFMLVASVFLSFNTLIFSTILIIGFWLYPFINQRFGLFANIWVSACSVIAFINGAFVYEITPLIYLAMATTFFVNIGREILLDALDHVGDQAVGKPSIRLSYGEKGTKIVVWLFFALGSASLLVYWFYFPSFWPWLVVMLLVLWLPFFMKRTDTFRKWALFNVRISHFFFLALLFFLVIDPLTRRPATPAITAAYCLNRLDQLQSKQNGFYPIGAFPIQRAWFSKKTDEDNGVFATAWVAYILHSTNQRHPSKFVKEMVDRANATFEMYRNRRREASYNFWQTGVGKDIPFPNSYVLAHDLLRLPDDYDDTALIQLARDSDTMDQPVRDKMVKYAMRPQRKAVESYPSEHRTKKVYETWYADKKKQDLDIVVMANVMLFVTEKKFALQTPDLHTLDCLRTSIDEGWYFTKPSIYAPFYSRPALILYSLTRLVSKDKTGQFTAQRVVLIRHLRQALEKADHAIDKVMIASSLCRLGESVHLNLSKAKLVKDAQAFGFTSYKFSGNLSMLPDLSWRSEALSWSLVYELLSFKPTITWS